ncbi:MAG: hypothetical protein IJS48_03640 [Prevotella sp.]|nr:hypothetical protein [Prevotella sp.]
MTNDYHDKKTMAISLMSTMRLMGLRALIGLILMGLMSCSSSDDAVDNNPPAPVLTEVAISFSGSESQEDAVTRAAGKPLHDAGPTQFTVWGYKDMSFAADVYGDWQTVFPGYAVDWHDGSAATTTTNSNGWEYIKADPEQTIKYWDFSAMAYRFFGVTGGLTGVDGTYGASNEYGTYKLTLSADASGVNKDEIATNIAATPYFSRLWFSTGHPVAYPNKKFGKPVTLEFLKPLTRVRYIFKYAYPREGIKLTDASFKPTADVAAAEEEKVKIARKGTVTVHYPKDGTETKEWYTTEVDDDKATRLTDLTVDYDPEDDSKDYVTLSSGMMTSDGWYTLLPNISQGSYTLSVKVNGEDKSAVVPQQYMQWLPGYSYTYIFKITDEGGVEIGWVEYAVTPWTELEADRTVYNW